MRRFQPLLLLLAAFVFAALACGPAGSEPSAAELTATALSASLQQPPAEASTDTPVPEASNGDETVPPAEDESTAPPAASGGARETATAVALGATATAAQRTAEAAAETEAMLATLEPIQSELVQYGISPDEGQLGWVHPPVEISVEGYLQYDWDVDLVRVVDDFVIAADITMNTQFGSTGCGYALRSDGKEEAVNQYVTIATRGGSGRVLFGTMVDGNLVRDDSKDIFAGAVDPNFEWQNDETNRVAVVGRGNTFSIYTNGLFIGDITTDNSLERGLVAFIALNESGTTHCLFENAFLWLLE